jgi:effector-binding domain-containing protein
MKALKIIGLVVLGLIVIVAVLSFIAPVKMHAERSIFIKTPKESVFPNVKLFANWPKFSPWMEKDPNAQTKIEGTDGTVGAKYSWEGNNDIGKGEQTITKIEENKNVESDLHFIKPYEGHATSYIRFEDSADGTKVIWGFNSEMPRPFNVMGLFMNMSDAIGKEFDKGLGKLKAVSEKEAAEKPAMKISEITMEPRTYIGIKQNVAFDKLSAFFGESYAKMHADLSNISKSGAKQAGPPSGLYFSYDKSTMTTDVAAVAPVTGLKGKAGSCETFEIKGGKALEMDFYGEYKNLSKGHDKLKEYAASKNMKVQMPVIEEYITDPASEKDPNKWLTKIYYRVD